MPLNIFWPRRSLVALALTAACLSGAVTAQEGTGTVTRTINEQVAAETAAQQSQARIARLDDETQRLLNEYRQVVSEAESLRRYNELLTVQIKSQDDEVVSIEEQLAQIDTTNRELLPLMHRLLETLEQFVALDLPFLMEERGDRVDTLKDIMGRADVSTAEKYRRIMEAYGVEMEYGRTIESYRGQVGSGDDARTVDFLRLGRVALLYQTLDGRETGYWNADDGKWVVDSSYHKSVRDGLRVAKRQAAPDLMIVPVPAPVEAK